MGDEKKAHGSRTELCRNRTQLYRKRLRSRFHGDFSPEFVRSDPGDDLDPSLMHRLEPLSLLLGILVWDGADEVVAPAVCRSCGDADR